MQILDYLMENLKTTPEAMGDPQRETQEEILERHQRVTASSLLAIAAHFDVAAGDAGAGCQNEQAEM